MALSINAPISAPAGGFARAVRRNNAYTVPSAATSGGIPIPGGSTAGGTAPVSGGPMGPTFGPLQSYRGNPQAVLQAILMSRANPYRNQSMEEDELRRSALNRLRG